MGIYRSAHAHGEDGEDCGRHRAKLRVEHDHHVGTAATGRPDRPLVRPYVLVTSRLNGAERRSGAS
jgi:hypothetical protein